MGTIRTLSPMDLFSTSEYKRWLAFSHKKKIIKQACANSAAGRVDGYQVHPVSCSWLGFSVYAI